MEFHHCPKSTCTTNNLKVWKSRSLAQRLKFFLSSLLPFKVQQHGIVKSRHILRSLTRLWCFWHEYFNNNYLPIIWKCFIAIPQKFHAILITPVMEYILQEKYRYINDFFYKKFAKKFHLFSIVSKFYLNHNGIPFRYILKHISSDMLNTCIKYELCSSFWNHPYG